MLFLPRGTGQGAFCRQAAFKGCHNLPLFRVARSKQDPINRSPPAGASKYAQINETTPSVRIQYWLRFLSELPYLRKILCTLQRTSFHCKVQGRGSPANPRENLVPNPKGLAYLRLPDLSCEHIQQKGDQRRNLDGGPAQAGKQTCKEGCN